MSSPDASGGSKFNFNFRLGRMRMNVERKRKFVAEHIEELRKMEDEFVLTCPHTEVTTSVITVPSTDIYNREGRALQCVCSVCGFTTTRPV